MPKVTDAYRAARRDEIASATMRALRRRGVAETSIADIVAESGLSAGAIYSNFTNKAELAQYVAAHVTAWKMGELRALAEDGLSHPPLEVMLTMLESAEQEAVPFDLVVQFWGEAMADPSMREVTTATVERLRAALAGAVGHWAAERRPDDPGFAVECALAMSSVCQGYILAAALGGPRDPSAYIRRIAGLLG